MKKITCYIITALLSYSSILLGNEPDPSYPENLRSFNAAMIEETKKMETLSPEKHIKQCKEMGIWLFLAVHDFKTQKDQICGLSADEIKKFVESGKARISMLIDERHNYFLPTESETLKEKLDQARRDYAFRINRAVIQELEKI